MATSKHPMLDGNVDEKDYGKINIAMTEEEKNTPIPEPAYQAPPFLMEDEEEPTATTSSPEPKEKKEREPFNENLDEISTSEKRREAEAGADVAIGMYCYMHQVAEMVCNVSMSKAEEDHLEGNINLYHKILVNGEVMTVEQAIIMFNSSSVGAFTVDQEFKDSVRPILVRILQKKGIGLTDEEKLIFLVVMDLVKKVPKLIQLIKQRKKFYLGLGKESKGTAIENPTMPTKETAPTQQPPTQQPQQDAPKSNPAPSPLADSEGGSLTIEDDEPKKRRGRKPNVKP